MERVTDCTCVRHVHKPENIHVYGCFPSDYINKNIKATLLFLLSFFMSRSKREKKKTSMYTKGLFQFRIVAKYTNVTKYKGYSVSFIYDILLVSYLIHQAVVKIC